MTQEDFDKTRWSPYDSYRMETDQFQVIFISTCNCIPKITKIIKSKVRNGKSLWRSEVVRYVCNDIYYKNKKRLSYQMQGGLRILLSVWKN